MKILHVTKNAMYYNEARNIKYTLLIIFIIIINLLYNIKIIYMYNFYLFYTVLTSLSLSILGEVIFILFLNHNLSEDSEFNVF